MSRLILNLDNIITDIDEYFDDLDSKREEIIKISRETVRYCSEAIKTLHRGELVSYEDKIKTIQRNHFELKSLITKNPLYFSRYLWTAEQEYVEAVLLLAVLGDKDFPTPNELKVEPLSYVLGMADLIGEMNRMCLNKIREGDLSKIDDNFKLMEDIYDHLFSFDYPKGILRNLRPKLDAMRRVLEKLRSDISLAIYMDRLK